MDRRLFLKFFLSIPVLGSLLLLISPIFRYLRPSSGPFNVISNPDFPKSKEPVSFPLTDFPAAWSYQTFVFEQMNREYTFKGYQVSRIPGYAVRLPGEDLKFVVFSRICPHLGCIFNFLPDPSDAAKYNYPQAKTPVFACPCHLSVYDPLQDQNGMPGKVVSGPAPRPPRHFDYNVKDGRLFITDLERGGIA